MADRSSSDYWRSAAGVYHAWRTGKKALVDMTDGELQMYDDYMHVVLVGREFRRLELEMQPARRLRFPVRWIALLPAAIVVVMLLYSLFRGLI